MFQLVWQERGISSAVCITRMSSPPRVKNIRQLISAALATGRDYPGAAGGYFFGPRSAYLKRKIFMHEAE